MSPLNRSWFLCWDDGTIDYNLPEDMTDYVDEYCQLRHSMIPRKSRVRSGGISTGVKASTSLRLLDIDDRYDKEEYSRSKSLYYSISVLIKGLLTLFLPTQFASYLRGGGSILTNPCQIYKGYLRSSFPTTLNVPTLLISEWRRGT